MSILSGKPKGILRFEESIKSKYTKRNYLYNLNQFLDFAGIDFINDLLEIKHDRLQDLLEDYLIELKRSTNPNSIPSKFRGIKHFCVMNRINLNWDIIHKMFPQKTQVPHPKILYCTGDQRHVI